MGIRGLTSDKTWEEKSYGEMLVVEGFTPRQIPGITMRSAEITGFLAPLIAISVVMQQILSLLGAQKVIGDFVTSMGGYHAVLFTAMDIVFFSGMVLESLPVTIILAPILAPFQQMLESTRSTFRSSFWWALPSGLNRLLRWSLLGSVQFPGYHENARYLG